MADSVFRGGRFVKQEAGYRAFVPASLPLVPPLQRDGEMDMLLSAADTALGRLDGISSILPDPDFFVAMYVRYESVLSSQIEGTQSTLEDVLEFEVDPQGGKKLKNVEEVVNHIQAMKFGLQRLSELPVSLRLLREIHAKLMDGVRGGERTPGEFRRSQNWIGPKGCTIQTATFIPPPVPVMEEALDNLQKFLNSSEPISPLILSGLAHAQFETIHPFLDGNGRVGRLLVTFLLCQRGVLHQPLLYLSHYLKRYRAEYYERLTAVREKGDWEGWMKFFLRGVIEVSEDATKTAKKIRLLREEGQKRIDGTLKRSVAARQLFDHLFQEPLITVRIIERRLECSFSMANKLARQFMEMGFFEETTGGARNRSFRFKPYLDLFAEPPVLEQETQFDFGIQESHPGGEPG